MCTTETTISELRCHIKDDLEISWDQVHSVQKAVNDHCKWLKRIFGVGVNWGHEDRFNINMVDKSEVVAPLYLLVKDHKNWSVDSTDQPPSRPLCSGIQGFNRHLSEMLSIILEPLSHATQGNDIDSTSGLLEKICELNSRKRANDLEDKIKSPEVQNGSCGRVELQERV